MNFLLKIVEGPNKGAEIALPEGVAVTLGKSDGCDIVLADATLPDAPLSIEATASGVTAGGEPLAPFAVKTAGATPGTFNYNQYVGIGNVPTITGSAASAVLRDLVKAGGSSIM